MSARHAMALRDNHAASPPAGLHAALRIIVGLLVVGGVAAIAPVGVLAQTTQPADPGGTQSSTPSAAPKSAWPATISAFANALVDASSASSVDPFLDGDDALIQQFNCSPHETVAALREKAILSTVIATRAYFQTPATMASDLASDFRQSALPDAMKRRFIPANEKDARRANEVAAQWVASALSISGSEPMGVIVLWLPDHEERDRSSAGAGDDDAAHAPIRLPLFILVKGRRLENGGYHIRQVRYGDPIPPGG